MPKSKIQAATAPETQPDGRRRRSDANRRRIAQAMIDLSFKGELAPSAERVAEQAGVGRRTVFRLFSDMEGVYREAYALMIARLRPILEEEISGPDWRARIDQMIERRARLFEEVMPVKIAADAYRNQSGFLQQEHADFARLLRGILMFVLPKAVSDDRPLLDALDLAMSFESWRRLRHEQKLQPKAATAVVKRMVGALID